MEGISSWFIIAYTIKMRFYEKNGKPKAFIESSNTQSLLPESDFQAGNFAEIDMEK